MDELLREHGWYLVWALTVAAAWLHGNNRATDEHIASLEQQSGLLFCGRWMAEMRIHQRRTVSA